MACFDSTKETKLVTDAFLSGLLVTLIQNIRGLKDRQAVAYAS